MSDTDFPNYLQMPTRVPLWVWHVIRFGSVAALVAVVVAAVVSPDDTLTLFWVC